MPIHSTAVVDARAAIDPTAEIGPYVVIDGPVRVGPRVRVMAHAYLTADTWLAADCVVHPGAIIGHEPQDLSYRDAPTGVRIGERTVVREHAEIHRGTQPNTQTVVGADCYVMSHAHIAHNCVVGSRVIVASGALVAGHVTLGDLAFISGNCVVHQHVRVGRLAIMRGLSRVSKDIVPFAIHDETNMIRGVNRVGLRRAGFDAGQVRAISAAFRRLFRVRTNLRDAMAEIEGGGCTPEVAEVLAFIRSAKRGVAAGPPDRDATSDEADDE